MFFSFPFLQNQLNSFTPGFKARQQHLLHGVDAPAGAGDLVSQAAQQRFACRQVDY